jgi:3D (Asp-Asp-Asp) domain-containing protein
VTAQRDARVAERFALTSTARGPHRLGHVKSERQRPLRYPTTVKGSAMKLLARSLLFVSLCVVTAMLAAAQDRMRTVSASHNATAISAVALDPTYIPAGSKVYVNDIRGMNGFENYLAAAIRKKKVALLLVTDRSQADFEINGYAENQKAGWAKIIFGSGRPESEASIQLVNLRTSVVAYAVASYKVDAWNGKKSTAEHLAKNLRQKMERDEKRLRKP